MPVFPLSAALLFPSVDLARYDGLLAVGGDLSPDRLLLAYRSGIFPWYNEPPIHWWSPDPRFVLFPNALRVSNSMRTLLKKERFRFSVNRAFDQVIANCKTIPRVGQEGTWIGDDMQQAYSRLHQLGYAHSAEAWEGDELVGGLYGIRIGRVFFGESMFSKVSNASKYAFIRYVETLIADAVELIDCQVYTPHLESLGACMIPRTEFVHHLEKWTAP